MHVVTRIHLFHQPQDVDKDFANISQTPEVVATIRHDAKEKSSTEDWKESTALF